MNRLDKLQKEIFKIFVAKNCKTHFVGSLELSTIESLHQGRIKTINYDSRTVFLDPDKYKTLDD